MSLDKYLAYRGSITDLIGLDNDLIWSAGRSADHPGAVYRLALDTLKLTQIPLPCGALSIAVIKKDLYIGGADKKIYRCPLASRKVTVFCENTEAAPLQLASVSNARPCVLAGDKILVLDPEGKIAQEISLPAKGTALATEASEKWLVVGTETGMVLVFEEKDLALTLSESSQLHEGAVTALVFETGETRFLSAGLDQRFLTTHARGRLEPEDRGRSFNHNDRLTCLLQGPAERFYSGGHDKTIKAWPKTPGGRPLTIRENMGKVAALALATRHKQPLLAAACEDKTIVMFALDQEGKPGECIQRTHDAYARAAQELKSDQVQRRETALKELAGYGDTRALTMISRQIDKDSDLQTRLAALNLIGKSDHPRAAGWLEPLLKNRETKIRMAAFNHLKQMSNPADLGLPELALAVKKADVGQAAIALLESRAKQEDRFLARLIKAVSAEPFEVRQAALFSLEKIFAADAPDASFHALGSGYADLQRLALIRLYHRHLLHHPHVRQALRRWCESADGAVRRTAFLLTLLTREKLATALRLRDPDIDRELQELAVTGMQPVQMKTRTELEKSHKKEKKTRKIPDIQKPEKFDLSPDEVAPLLHAMSSRPVDTCLAGAMGLASLGDGRAFGLLLQLSREEDDATRVAVCRAFALLDDRRCLQHLGRLLDDPSTAVRDAAFSALATVQKDPLANAQAGLNAANEDVRQRALSLLIREMRKIKTFAQTCDGPLARLVVRALNDDAPSVRQEAFKAVFNLRQVGEKTLRFLLQSIHADIRTDVLTEIMAREKESWTAPLLLECLNDPAPALRDEAFDYALKKFEGREDIVLQAGIQALHVDIRLKTVDRLKTLYTPTAQAILTTALSDTDRNVRKNALDALVQAEAGEALTRALHSRYADVRVRAAVTCARHGDTAAKAPLLEFLRTSEPETDDERKIWRRSICSALEGLGLLGDPSAADQVMAFITSNDPDIRKTAADALIWIGDLPTIEQMLAHSDPQVRIRSALAMAYLGDAGAANLLFSPSEIVLSERDRLTAAIVLAGHPENSKMGIAHLQTFLDNKDADMRATAFNALLLMELVDPGTTPQRCLAGLASRTPRIRLQAAEALQALQAFQQGIEWVTRRINHQGKDPPWTLSGQEIMLLAKLLIYAQPRIRAKTAALLHLLQAEKPIAWQHAWPIFQKRYTDAIDAALAAFEARNPSEIRYDPMSLSDTAFGAYVGLVREQGSYHRRNRRPGIGSAVIRVRQSALAGLGQMVEKDANRRDQIFPVFVQALSDPNQAVRKAAFSGLQQLEMNRNELVGEALAAGYTDVGFLGLQLITEGVSIQEAESILTRVMSIRTDGLEEKAAELLMARQDTVTMARHALNAASEKLRRKAVSWLSKACDTDRNAVEALQAALQSRHLEIRFLAAATLTAQKDPVVFDALRQLLFETRGSQQDHVIRLLRTLNDTRVPELLLDRIENDPEKTAQTAFLFKTIGAYRHPAIVNRLLEKLDQYPVPVFETILSISGYDQRICDPEDETTDKNWMAQQHPRHDDILARLLSRCFEKNMTTQIRQLIPAARWSPMDAVDSVLPALAGFPDDEIRHHVAAAMGWRLRKRKGPAEPLVRLLTHPDADTRFLAAEGLAKAGRGDGIQVLLTGVELLPDIDFRMRSVQALGELGDARALDLLLRLATEENHALQETAIAAIGHLERSAKAREIFDILSKAVAGNDGRAEQALHGLRWFNTVQSWQRIRERAADRDFYYRDTAVGLLGHHDHEATRQFIVQLLERNPDYHVVKAAYASSRRLWKTEDLTPQYALAKGCHPDIDPDLLTRLNEKGDVGSMFAIVSKSENPQIRAGICAGLLKRSPLPVAEAGQYLADNNAKAVQTAGHILGRAAKTDEPCRLQIAQALDQWTGRWTAQREKMGPGPVHDTEDIDIITACLLRLIWAAGRLGAAQTQLLAIARKETDPLFQPIRKAAFDALAKTKPEPEIIDLALHALAQEDAGLRWRAAAMLDQPDQDHLQQAVTKLLSDRIALRQLSRQTYIQPYLKRACADVHYQSTVLPYMTGSTDLTTLYEQFSDPQLSNTARMGIVESLSRSACEKGEEMLTKIGGSEHTPEALRKAAWRGLRRSWRARMKKKEKMRS